MHRSRSVGLRFNEWWSLPISSKSLAGLSPGACSDNMSKGELPELCPMSLSAQGPLAETKSSCVMDHACHRSLDPEEALKG